MVAKTAGQNRDTYEVRSPVTGMFYLVPAPGEKPYVALGDRVEAGQVLCFIETFGSVKEIPGLPADHSGDALVEVHHEMAADIAGEVVELLAENAEGVEHGRTLFRVRPEAL